MTLFGEGVFQGCRALSTVKLGMTGMTHIPVDTFVNCMSLVSIRIPASVGLIGAYAFRECAALTEINLPTSLTLIGDLAFAGCNFSRIAVPDSVARISFQAFHDCSSLSFVCLPKNRSLTIGNNVFENCNALTTLQLPRMELTVWPRFFEQFNHNRLFARIGLTGEVARKTIIFSFLKENAKQLFEY